MENGMTNFALLPVISLAERLALAGFGASAIVLVIAILARKDHRRDYLLRAFVLAIVLVMSALMCEYFLGPIYYQRGYSRSLLLGCVAGVLAFLWPMRSSNSEPKKTPDQKSTLS
jgi:hypothetical protein